MHRNISRDKAIKNAIASVKMEGFNTNPKLEADCKLIMQGKLTLKDCVSRITKKVI